MALFKINKGLASNLPNTYNTGWCYFTTDDGKFYIDIADSNNHASGERVSLNSHCTDGIRFGTVTANSSSHQKSANVPGVDHLFQGLLIAITNNTAAASSVPVTIKVNNIIDTVSFPNDDGFRSIFIDATTTLTNEWKPGQTMLLVYDKVAEHWIAIGGVSKVQEASTVSIVRYNTTT